MTVHRILFVCMGNICRSPTAEGVFQNLVNIWGVADRFEIDSAGTGGWHIGLPPDERAQAATMQRSIDISDLKARQVSVEDMQNFNTIIAMDKDNLKRLKEIATETQKHKIRLLLEYSDSPSKLEVPDPYYGGENGFDLVLDLIEDACEKLLGKLLPR